MYPIYTIGYGNRNLKEFIELLINYKIKYLIDIRSKPFSKYQTEFNKNSLKHNLLNSGIKYIFMGDLLGGQPADIACYTNGKTDYRKLKKQEFFQQGLNRLNAAYHKNLCVAVMCSESKPETCHRTKLVGQELVKMSIEVMHIDEIGSAIKHDEILFRMTNGQESLFDIDELFCSSNKQIKGISNV